MLLKKKKKNPDNSFNKYLIKSRYQLICISLELFKYHLKNLFN